MEFWQGYAIIRRRWWLVLGMVALATLAAGSFTALAKPKYRATTTINTGIGQKADFYATSVQLADLQAVLVSRYLLTQLDQQVQLNKPPKDIAKAITVTRINDSAVLRVDVVWSDPLKAQQAANKLADLFIDYEGGQVKLQAERDAVLLEQQADLAKARLERALASVPTGLPSSDPVAAAANEEIIAARHNYSDVFDKLQNAKATANNTSSGNNIAVIDRAALPSESEPSQRIRTLVFGSLLGALMGMSFAIAAEYLNPLPRLRRTIEDDFRVPILAAIPWEPHLSWRYFPKPSKLGAARREAFRLLRANLLFASPSVAPERVSWEREHGRVGARALLVLGDHLGVGCTSVLAYLGSALANFGLRVLVVDMDLTNPSIHRYFHMPQSPAINSWLSDRAMPVQELVEQSDDDNVSLLSSVRASADERDRLTREGIESLIAEAKQAYDIILFDSPTLDHPGDVRTLAEAVDGVLLVVRPQAGRSGNELRDAMHFLGNKLLGVVINGITTNVGVTSRPIAHDHGENRVFPIEQPVQLSIDVRNARKGAN